MPMASPWVVGICSVIFDVDVGQKISHLVPENCISETERTDVAFNSFPDSMSLELYTRNSIRDSSFFFRIHRRSERSDGNGSTPVPGAYLYGFVLCRQRQDERLRRGGEQLSVVVLSHYPLSAVLSELSKVVGQMYFNDGSRALDLVHQEILSWPPPCPGAIMQLPLGPTVITATVPMFHLLPPPVPEAPPPQPSPRSTPGVSRTSSGQSLLPTPSVSGGDAMLEPTLGVPHHLKHLRVSVRRRGSDAGDPSPSASPRSPALPRSLSLNNTTKGPSLMASNGGLAPPRTGQGASRGGAPNQGPGDGPGPTNSFLATAQSGSPLARLGKRNSGALEEILLGPYHEVDLLGALEGALQHLWTLWEMMVVGAPLMVVAPSPTECSRAVAALVCLVTPLQFLGDHRPYFTIHDPSFRQLMLAQDQGDQGSGPPLEPSLIGVTNLYFLKALPKWPNILSVGKKEQAGTWSGGSGGSQPPSRSTSRTSLAVRSFLSRLQGPSRLMTEHICQLWTSYSAIIQPDTSLLNTWSSSKPSESREGLTYPAHHKAVKRHFATLTSSFLAPFNRYFEPISDQGPLPWHPEAFLKGLSAEDIDPVLRNRVRGGLQGLGRLYQRFMSSPHFSDWFRTKRGPWGMGDDGVIQGVGKLSGALQHKDEVEMIQKFQELEGRLQEVLGEVEQAVPTQGHESTELSLLAGCLKEQLVEVFQVLPEDLKQTLLSSPSRRKMLSQVEELKEKEDINELVARLQG